MKKINFLFIALAVISFASCKQSPQSEQDMPKDFLELAADRYSVRHFTDTPVEQEKIDKIRENVHTPLIDALIQLQNLLPSMKKKEYTQLKLYLPVGTNGTLVELNSSECEGIDCKLINYLLLTLFRYRI